MVLRTGVVLVSLVGGRLFYACRVPTGELGGFSSHPLVRKQCLGKNFGSRTVVVHSGILPGANFFFPFQRSCLPYLFSPLPFVAQIWGHIAGALPPSPLRYVHSF